MDDTMMWLYIFNLIKIAQQVQKLWGRFTSEKDFPKNFPGPLDAKLLIGYEGALTPWRVWWRSDCAR